MQRFTTAEEKYKFLTEEKIPKLIRTLALPTIASSLVTSFYNMADTFFVGRLGTSATGAVGVVFPLMTIIQALGFTFGHGTGNYISRALGRKETDDAEIMAATGFVSSLIGGVLFTILGLIFLNPLVNLLGSTPTIAPHARSYAFYILLAAPFMVASFVLNNILRFQGSAFYGMIGICLGAVLNIVLDPLLIFVCHMGVGGASLATAISQMASFFLLLAGCSRGGNIPIKLKNFQPSLHRYKEILRGGLPSLCRQGLASVSTICLNLAAGPYGDAAIAAMSVVTRIMQFAHSMLIGLGQGFQPVCGFNYGAGRYARVKEAFWFCVRIAFCVLLVFAVLAFIFAPRFIAVFRADDPDVIRIGALALRLQCVIFPTVAYVVMCNMYLQTIGMALKASIVAMARQGLFFIPAILILPHIFGLLGVQMSQLVADTCALLLALPLGISTLNSMQKDTPTNEPTPEKGQA